MILAPHEIHVWLAFDRVIDDPRRLEQFADLLTVEDAERRDKLHFALDRHQFLVTRALQRLTLSEYAPEVAPRDWEFTIGERGKPAIAPEFAAHGLHFNLAHTPGLVAFAVSRLPGVGIDAENSRTRAAPLHLANRYFTETESHALNTLPVEERSARFFALWTLKESWLKATGEGLSAGLGNASFDVDGRHRVRGVEFARDVAAYWRFWQFAPSEEHVLALALRADPMPASVAVTLHKFSEGSGATFIEK